MKPVSETRNEFLVSFGADYWRMIRVSVLPTMVMKAEREVEAPVDTVPPSPPMPP